MRSVSHYYDPKLQGKFAEALPYLRAQVGQVPFAEHDYQFGVGGETFRAYRNWARPPSETYRNWATQVCDQLSPLYLQEQLNSQSSFDKWHSSLATNLQDHWRMVEGNALSFAHQHKLIDLFIKWLSGYNFGSPIATAGFVAHARCALDRQTLQKLNECLSYALPMPEPSMGHVLSQTTYVFCQELIAEFSMSCGSTPLMFDYFAWKRGG